MAFDNKSVSYEILVNGNNAIRHRKYLRKIPENVLPESVDEPVLAEDERFFSTAETGNADRRVLTDQEQGAQFRASTRLRRAER